MKTILASLFPIAVGLVLFFVFVAGPLWMSRRKREELCDGQDFLSKKEKEGSCGRVAEGFSGEPLAAVSPQQGNCKWFEDEDGIWWTECNNGFQFTNEGPRENKMNFCCYCGHALEPIAFVEPEEDYETMRKL